MSTAEPKRIRARRRRFLRIERVAGALLVAVLLASACSGDEPPRPEPEDLGEGPAASSRVTEPAENWFESGCELPFVQMQRVRRGYYPGRSPEILYVANEPTQFPNNHSGPWDYLARVPLVLYGPGFIEPVGKVDVDHDPTVADLAPTFAELTGFDFPADRAGVPLTEALVPADERPDPPKLIITIVWDGGGRSVLEAHPKAWPNLRKMIEGGASINGGNVGSSPSITPAIHANIGTGTFPRQHGVVDIKQLENGKITGPSSGLQPTSLLVPTFADLFDTALDNKPKVGMLAYKAWHLAMVGFGAAYPKGDKDVAVMVDHSSKLVTNEDNYYVPDYLHDVPGFQEYIDATDRADGEADGKWLGNDVLEDINLVRKTPAWTKYQTDLIKAIIAGEDYGKDGATDLFFTNYKQVDEVGHNWSMLGPEMEDVLSVTDAQLPLLFDFLDKEVGKNEWVVALTADHGPAPDLKAKDAWPLHMPRFISVLSNHFDSTPEEFILEQRAIGLWPKPGIMESLGITEEDIANFIIDYRIEDDVPEGQLPEKFEPVRKEPIFSTSFPSSELGKVWECSRRRSAEG